MPKSLPKLSTYHVLLRFHNGFASSVQIIDTEVTLPVRRRQIRSQYLTTDPLPYADAKQLAKQARHTYFPDRHTLRYAGLSEYTHTSGIYTSVVKRYQVTSAGQT